MGEDDTTKAGSAVPEAAAPAKAPDRRLSRRLVIVKVAGLAATPALAGCVVAPPAQPVYAPAPVVRGTGYTDSDPNDGPGNGRGPYGRARGTGYTDSDPNDGPGQGRGGYRAPARGTGYTDSDPNDGPGNGRGPYGRGGRVRTGYSDSDPNDGAGYGRGGGYRGGRVRTGYTDSDPNDGAGYGRRGY